jgi:hypothetical protein
MAAKKPPVAKGKAVPPKGKPVPPKGKGGAVMISNCPRQV